MTSVLYGCFQELVQKEVNEDKIDKCKTRRPTTKARYCLRESPCFNFFLIALEASAGLWWV